MFSTFTFDVDGANNPNGSGSLPGAQVSGFNFGVGNALADNSVPLLAGGTFQLYYQASLASLIDSNGNPTTPAGLNTNYELTAVASVTEQVTSISSNGGNTTVQFQFAPVQAANSFLKLYYDGSVDANPLAGTGYADGTLILSATPSAAQTNSGTIGQPSAGTPVTFDQFGVNNYPGIQTVQGNGSANLGGAISTTDANFFLTPGLTAIQFSTALNLPFTLTNPSAAFYDGSTTPLVANRGTVNGTTAAGGTDYQFQAGGAGITLVASANSIALTKLTNGSNNNSAPGPYVPVGSTVNFTYVVTNTGSNPLSGVTVTDDNGTPGNTADDFNPIFFSGDSNSNGMLDTTETWTYSATRTATAGQYTNIATAAGTPPTGPAVSASDSDNHFGAMPAIKLVKLTNGTDNDTAPGATVTAGSTVTFSYVVTNPGNVPLSGVGVSDDNGTPGNPADDFNPAFVGGDGNSNGLLDPSETWTYTASRTAVLGQYTNTATVNATPPPGAGTAVSSSNVDNSFGVPAPVNNTISIGDVTQAEGDSGTTLFVFNVTRINPSGVSAVDFATAPGTASEGGDYNAATGSVVFDTGEVTKTITVGVKGDTNLEPDQDFFVNLSNPINATIDDAQGRGLIVNDDTLLPAIKVNDVAITEGNAGARNLSFSLTLSRKSSQPVGVKFHTTGNSATSGVDYVAKTGTATFAPFATQAVVTIQVKGDTAFEPDETFFMDLTNPTNATIADSRGVGTILNDDAAPMPKVSIDINNESAFEGNSGLVPITFKVMLDKASSKTVSVHYATANGTASAGSDYNAASGTVTFTAGQTSKMVTVFVKGDKVKEANETFFVNLTSPVNAVLGNSKGTGTIKNDD